jgi:hypothetical protein
LQKVNKNNFKSANNFSPNYVELLYNNSRLVSLGFQNRTNYSLLSSININFLRYERLYTKLKYSRSPAYDIVSGGFAAILAGFIGFLISEKFGFELVDSGDFYYLFMYAVFAVFIVRPFFNISNFNNNSVFKGLSLRNLLNFYVNLWLFFLSYLKIR